MSVLFKKLPAPEGQESFPIALITTENDVSDILSACGYEPMSEYEDDSEEDFQCSSVLSVINDNRPYIKPCIFGTSIRTLLDCGSQRTLVSAATAPLWKCPDTKILTSNLTLTSASGDVLDVVGRVYLPFQFEDRTRIIETTIVEDLPVDCIAGMDFFTAFDLHITRGDEILFVVNAEECVDNNPPRFVELSSEQVAALEKIKKLFKPAMSGQLEVTSLIEHKIEITEEFKDSPPVRVSPYPYSPSIHKALNEEIDRLLQLGVIEESYSDWALNAVPIKKPNGTVRLCLDARKLNSRTKRDSYPLAHIGRILGRLGKTRYLSTIDLKDAFLQIPLSEGSKPLTAFCIQGRGMFQYTRLPFGLTNSPATLSRLMDKILGAGELEPWVFVYLDDIIIASDNFEDHIRLLEEVARRLTKANLSINIEKSKFCRSEVPFLGYLLSCDGLRPDPSKVQGILDFEAPKTIRQIRRFLGMINYYRRFIPDFSAITTPISDLLAGKPKIVRWTKEANNAFRIVKERLITAPILANPDFQQEFTIQTDASDRAVAGVLTQIQDGSEKVISFVSQKLNSAQQNYSATEKEALAVLMAVEKFRGYVEGSHFKLVTDASALQYIRNNKWRPSSRLSRWSLDLQHLDMTIVHRKGCENIVPDALSRSICAIHVSGSGTSSYEELVRKVQQDPDDYPDFRLEDGQLWKYIPVDEEPFDVRFEWKMVPPPENRPQIIELEHEQSFHRGVEKTLARLQLRYYWPHMASETRKWIQKCIVCKESKPATVPTIPVMGKQKISDHPWQIIALDYIGPLPKSKAGNMHILVIQDLFSKWCQLHPTRRIESGNLCKTLREGWFLRNSIPEIVLTDNATTFLSKEFAALLKQYNVKHWTTSRHHSQGNPVERLNRSINAAIRTYCQKDQRNWDTKIADIEHVFNNTVHSATGFTPFFVTRSHEISVSGEDHLRMRRKEEYEPEHRVNQQKIICGEIYDLVAKNLLKAYTSSAQRYNLRKRARPADLKEGQNVYRRNFKQSNAGEYYNAKLAPMYLPCRVVAKRGSSSYELEDFEGKNLGIWPAEHIKP